MQRLETPVQIGLTVLLVVIAAFTLWRGGRPERLAMIALIAASLASPLVQNTVDLSAPQWGIMIVDILLFLAFAALAWRFDRSWIPWAAAFQLITVVTHLGYVVNQDILSRAYLSTSYLLFFGELAAITWGVLRKERAKDDRHRAPRRHRRLRGSHNIPHP